jgi:flagellar hook protein FlgE
MVRSMFSAVAGLRAHQTRMDVIGNNIANVNTYAFKSSTVTFKDTVYQTLTGASASTETTAGNNAVQVGYGTQVASINRLDTQSSFVTTDRSMDCMISGEGYFLTGNADLDCDPTDSDALYSFEFTRLGSFEFDSNGYLVETAGQSYVYGFQGDGEEVDDGSLTRISLPDDTTISGISIGINGTITGVDEEGQTIVIGRVAVANVANPAGLQTISNSKYKATINAGEIQAYTPGEGSTGSLTPNGLENSNVDLSKEFTDMITTQRGFQANSRIITVTDTMLEELVNLKR